uniref:Peptidase aspartic putative domain-containing protein n=1 Tax=Cacopsylla melanoneura TaxID=428564 RepID=A0A8D8TBX7_9HEMI
MTTSQEIELKVLTSKKEQIFAYMQETYDLTKKLADKNSLNSFKRRVFTVESMKQDFKQLIERINMLEIEMNVQRPLGFKDVDTMEDMYGTIKYADKLLNVPAAPTAPASPVISVNNETTESFVKLQRLELPSFNGDIADWPLFYNLFKVNIHDRPEILKVHKLQHLLTKLTGRAQLMCSGILPTEENYDVIWDALINRYEDKRNLATHYLDTLFNFKAQKMESSQHLTLFVDKVGAAIAALKALKIPDLADFILFYIGNLKIDDSTRRLFENSLDSQEIPTFEKLLTFAQNQTKILFRISPNCSTLSKFVKPESKFIGSSYNKPSTSRVSHSFFVKNNTCSLCEEDHPLFRCPKFIKLNPQDRYAIVKQHSHCVNCLGTNHRVSECASKHVCSTCRLKHHSLLHFTNNSQHDMSKHNEPKGYLGNTQPKLCNISSMHAGQSSQTSETAESAKVALCSQTEHSIKNTGSGMTVLLGTIKINMYDINGIPHVMRFLLDNGSMSNIIVQSAFDILQIPLQPSNSSLRGLGSSNSHVYGQVNLSFSSRFDNRARYTAQALVVDHVVDRMPVHSVDCSNLTYLNNLQLSDDEFMDPGPIFGILGSSIYPYILLGQSVFGANNQPVAVNTKLGHVIFGNAPIVSGSGKDPSICMFQSSLDNNLLKFWELEKIPMAENLKLSPEDIACEDIYSSEFSRNEHGIYKVPLPFKEDPSQLGDSFLMAKNRFLNLEKRLENSVLLRSDYNKAMSDLIEKGFMSKCSDQSDTSGYFIPHHMVTKSDSVSTKLRVVFDASAKSTSGKSLNDVLHCGAKLYSSLFCVLLNFRLFPYALNGDITKMFLQIQVCEKYWQFQKLIWRPSPNDCLTFFNLMVVTFGMKSSPFLALRTIHQLIIDEAEKFSVSKNIVDKLYMDDLVASFLTEDECILFYRNITDLFKSGGFNFTKWSANSNQVLQNIPLSDQLEQMVSWDEENFTLKVLGLCWNPKADVLFFKINQNTGPCTKRGMLSYILTIYDPLGLLAPIVLFVKLLIKKLWVCKIDWDSVPPLDIVTLWNSFNTQLPLLQNLSFPRHINVEIDCVFQLLGFSDASEKAYGAVIFSRVLLPNGTIKIEIICSKSKVAPLKVESIPRLELCGLLLLSDLMKVVTDSYSSKFKIDKSFCFTDSSVTLCWAHSSPHLFNVFVANRISKIQQNIDISNLFHIAGVDNPADVLSRGLLPEQLVECKLYLSGPSWLYTPQCDWPIRSYQDFTDKEVPEIKSNLAVVSIPNEEENSLLEMFSRCSTWSKLLKIVVYVLKFLKILPKSQTINAEALSTAENVVIKILQRKFFSDDMANIRKNIICSPVLRKLCPFLDNDGILRVGGRICNSDLSYSQQHPILLSSKHHVVGLIIDYLHQKICTTFILALTCFWLC